MTSNEFLELIFLLSRNRKIVDTHQMLFYLSFQLELLASIGDYVKNMAFEGRHAAIAKAAIDKRFEKIVRHPIGGPTVLTVANITTLVRIFISPIFLFFYLEHEELGIPQIVLPYVLLTLLLALETSDALDGYLARKYDQVTDLGKILDPMADSISRISVFLAFTKPPVSLPLLIVFIFIYRDSVISTLRTVCALRGLALAARPSGKLKAIIQALSAVTVTSLLIPHSLGIISTETLRTTSTYVVLVAAVYALYSGAEYLYANFYYVRRAILRKRKPSRK
jgi:CDP-diacylglycerol--glycerol-3-phosphate 3-phosphatidyltransferase